jgi:hypothetical protein
VIGWLFARRAVATAGKIPIPMFALVFVALCVLNSVAPAFPAGTKQWIVLWAPRARRPEVIVVSEGPCGKLERELAPVPRRRRRMVLPLFARV